MKLLILAFLGVTATPAIAQMAPTTTPVCPADAQPLPAELAGWSSRKPLVAATTIAALSDSQVKSGVALELALANTPAVVYPVRPSHPGGSVSHGGLVGFTVDHSGTYRVAIGSGAWIDLVRGSTAVESVAHGHGPNCSGIRKMVDFRLQPGAYVLQIAGNGAASLPLMIAKLP